MSRDESWLSYLMERRAAVIGAYQATPYKSLRADYRRRALHYAKLIRNWKQITGAAL